MHLATGAIATFETDEDARKAGYTVKLSEELATKMREMPRKARLGLISEKVTEATRFHPAAQLAGMTDEDMRKLKNAAKRARRARR